jgi:hypothetical protein
MCEPALPRLEPVIEACRGVDKAVFLGGEPFEYAAIGGLLRLALLSFTREVEVFTNGSLLPRTAGALAKMVKEFERRGGGARLVMTLAVDGFHADRMGKDLLEARVRQFLKLRSDHGIKVRFNVSGGAFQAEQYLARGPVLAALEGISPALAAFFGSLLDPGEIEDAFYFNPVFLQGRMRSGALPLRLAETARGGDLVIGPDLGDPPGRERLAVFNTLNAACAVPPPTVSVIGHLEGKGARPLAELARKALGIRPHPGCIPFDSKSAVSSIVASNDGSGAGWRIVAGRLLPTALDTGELALEATAWTEKMKMPLPVLHELMEMLSEHRPEAIRKSVKALTEAVIAPLGKRRLPAAPVMISRWLDGMARIPAGAPVRVPFGRTCIDTGLGWWPGETGFPLDARVMISQGPSISWSAGEISEARPGESGPADLAAWTRTWRLLAGEHCWNSAVPALKKEARRRYPADSGDGSLAGLISEKTVPGRDLFDRAAADPTVLFGFFGHDPRRGGPAIDDGKLMKARPSRGKPPRG